MKASIIKVISCFLVFLLTTGMLVNAFPNERREPINPLKTEAAELKTDIRSKSGSGKWQDTKENIETHGGREQTSEKTEEDSRESDQEDSEQEEPEQKETIEEKEVQEDKMDSQEVASTGTGKGEEGNSGTSGESE
ncbi:MAG: hypothetical protein IKW28_09845, partial [Lachnospiraceae bacterium]|nr:hypothetical protein [Lachnospiraceae bacterium]